MATSATGMASFHTDGAPPDLTELVTTQVWCSGYFVATWSRVITKGDLRTGSTERE